MVVTKTMSQPLFAATWFWLTLARKSWSLGRTSADGVATVAQVYPVLWCSNEVSVCLFLIQTKVAQVVLMVLVFAW